MVLDCDSEYGLSSESYVLSPSSVACTAAGAVSAKRSLFKAPSSACCSWASKARGGQGRGARGRGGPTRVRRCEPACWR